MRAEPLDLKDLLNVISTYGMNLTSDASIGTVAYLERLQRAVLVPVILHYDMLLQAWVRCKITQLPQEATSRVL